MAKLAKSVFDMVTPSIDNPLSPVQDLVAGVVTPIEEAEVNLTVKVSPTFKEDWDLYFAQHQRELKLQGIRTSKAFFVHIATLYMNANP